MTATARPRSWPSLAILTLLWLAVYGPGLFTPPLMDDVDASHADAGHEILTRGDWVTLHENGIRYLEKAPLPYWGMAAGMKLFGPQAWSARLFLHLSVLALALFLYFFGRRFLTERAGFWSAVVLLASCGPYLFTRILIPDVTVGLWIGLALYLFLDGWQSGVPSRLSCWGIAALVALNVLTKSLIGIVFPCAIILAFLLLVGDLRHLRKMHLLSSAVVFLLVAAPWHILAALRNPPAGESKGFLWFYFVNEQFLRYLGKRYPHDYNTVPILLFYGLLLVWALPWSSFLPQALAAVRFRLPRVAGQRRSAEAVLLLLICWPAVILLFFSFSTRQEYYVAPGLPGLALILGCWMSRESEAPASSALARAGRRSAAVLLVAGLAVAVTAGFLAATTRTPPPGSDIFDALNQNPDVYTLSLGHFLDLTGGAMAFFRGPLAGTAIAFSLGSFLNWFLRRRHRPLAANWALVAMMIVFTECAHLALNTFYPILGSKQFAAAILRRFEPGELIVSDGEFANASSVRFYTGRQLLILNGRITGLWYGSLFPDAPDIFLDDARFAGLWAGGVRVYLVTGDPKKRESLASVAPAYLLAQAGGRFVLSNRP
ncbi:MAG TPA: glycosyltransferase family 39 protein [Candidatus Acidoferrum sp.]|nr:glycosyltransferase family 39 protein [Candidatus Acidoferrum sp.]